MPREMKDSGIEWIGEIPRHWDIVRMKSCISQRDSGAWGEEAQGEIGDEICLRIADFNYATFRFKNTPIEELTKRHYTKETIEYLKLQKNDILIEKSGGGEKTPVGRTVIFDKEYIALYANFMDRLRCAYFVLPMFMQYVFVTFYKNDYTRNYIKQTTGIQNLDLTSMLSQESVPLPPIKEQKAIADFLDRRCAEIDAVIEQTQATIEEYKKLKQALIMEATSIGIKSTRELKASGLKWITQIPKEWKVTRAKHILRKLERPMLPTDEVVICSNSGKAFYRGDKSTGLVSLTDNGYQGVEAGDLMIHGMDTWHGAIAISNIRGKCTSVVHVCDSTENKQYIAYYLQALAFRNVYKAITNGVRQNTSDYRSWDKAGSIQIVLPPYDEQCEIAEYLDKKCAEIDTLIEKKTALLAEMETYKKSLIFEHVTGKKEVC